MRSGPFSGDIERCRFVRRMTMTAAASGAAAMAGRAGMSVEPYLAISQLNDRNKFIVQRSQRTATVPVQRERRSAVPVAAVMLILTMVLRAPDAAEAEGDRDYGEYLSGTCVTCHGSGAPAAAIPNLERLSYDDFVQALEEYRDGIRTNATMVSVARGLGDEEIEALAAFYAKPE